MRSKLFAVAAIFAVLLCSTPTRAAVDFATGLRYVMTTGTLADCSAKAKTALSAYLQTPTENPPDSGDWVAFGPMTATGPQAYTSYAAVRCAALDQGYVVTFTCSAESPNSPYTAGALCLDVAHNFSGKPETPLPTPSPPPTGCNTANLTGTWTSDGGGGPTMTMTGDGNLTDGDGVSGNWVLYGLNATLTYYGNHNLTLTSDGKHLRGGGYSLTRKC